MRYLITGGSGKLGSDLIKQLKKEGHTVYVPSHKEMNLLNEKEVISKVLLFKPDVILHSAAYTNVDKAEKNFMNAYETNVIGTRNITMASELCNSKIIYISTDYVFDGKKQGLYEVNDKTNPLNTYGETKLSGEEIIKNNPNHFISRVSWLFGENGNDFVKTMINLSRNNKELSIIDDQIGSPTYSSDLASALINISKTDKYGTYHITNEGFCSWADFASKIFELTNKNIKINKVSTEEYSKGKEIALRPLNSKLDKSKLVSNGFSLLPNWEDSLKDDIKRLSLK